jgi:hypothetical protein
MRFLSALALAGLAGVGCVQPPLQHIKGLYNERFTRANLRSDGFKLYSAGYYTLPSTLPAGSPAKVTSYSSAQVNITILGLPYTMVPLVGEFPTEPQGIEGFLKKYFVEKKEELNIDAMGPVELKNDVLSGRYVIPMTKAQVYTALGPPAFIDQNVPATGVDYDRIFVSDLWTYPHQWVLFPTYFQLIFADGTLRAQK